MALSPGGGPGWFSILSDQGAGLRAEVGDRYGHHVKSLKEWTILKKIKKSLVLRTSGYFAVAKGDTGLTRSIFNGKRLSQRCPVPEPVNLIDIHGLINRMLAYGSDGKKSRRYNVVMGDFRHWFHQLSSPAWLQRLFGIRFRNKTYCWRTLPMGWSWSPVCAQAAAWGFLAYREDPEDPLLDESSLQDGMALPRWVRTPYGGWVTVYYDNFLIVTPRPEEAAAWEARIRKNEARLRVVIKPGSFDGFTYLGVHFQTEAEAMVVQPKKLKQTCSENRPPFKLRVTAAKKGVWEDRLASQPNRPGSCREGASWIGRAIFCVMCSGERVHQRTVGREVVEAGRRLGLESQQGWDTSMSGAGWEQVITATQRALQQATRIFAFKDLREQSRGRARIILACDASNEGYGWIALQPRDEGPMAGRAVREPTLYARMPRRRRV